MRFVVKFGGTEAGAKAVTKGVRHHVLEVPELKDAISLAKISFASVGQHGAEDLRGFLIEDERGVVLHPWEDVIANP